uniref:Copine domain-containing protein n=1 Tax=Caenorhabditis tropicalis TaxID=1561998 RepID=A0A1I7UYK9_9PELO
MEFNSEEDDHLISEAFYTLDPPTPTELKTNSFQKLVVDSKTEWGSFSATDAGDVFDKIVFHDDDLYDSAKDSFRYGRVTAGPTYNLVTGKMPEKVMEQVKRKDELRDEQSDVEYESDSFGEETVDKESFIQLYDSQMPKYFEYRSSFPEIRGIWTLLFDQNHYGEMSTFELQASICAALNSRHFLMICVGVDSFNTITGVEMSAIDRVTFRMALTRAVAGEFQPPLVKLAPKLLTGVSPMKRDVSELTPNIDVLFIPVTGAPESGAEGNDRFLIVVRVKEHSERLYQLSSGRIYKEQGGGVVEMSDLNDAFHTLVNEQTMWDMQQRRGSMFMLEPEPFITETSICLQDPEENPEDNKQTIAKEINEKESIIKKLISHVDIEHVGWILFGTALSYCFYQNAIKHLVK